MVCAVGIEFLGGLTEKELKATSFYFLVAMKTNDSEILKDAADDDRVAMDDLFGNKRKDKRNPLVMCGAIATAGVLVAGLVSFRQGNFRRSQMLMRTRVGFQAATVALLVGSVYLQVLGVLQILCNFLVAFTRYFYGDMILRYHEV